MSYPKLTGQETVAEFAKRDGSRSSSKEPGVAYVGVVNHGVQRVSRARQNLRDRVSADLRPTLSQ